MKKFADGMKKAIAENLFNLLPITEDQTIRSAYLSFLKSLITE